MLQQSVPSWHCTISCWRAERLQRHELAKEEDGITRSSGMGQQRLEQQRQGQQRQQGSAAAQGAATAGGSQHRPMWSAVSPSVSDGRSVLTPGSAASILTSYTCAAGKNRHVAACRGQCAEGKGSAHRRERRPTRRPPALGRPCRCRRSRQGSPPWRDDPQSLPPARSHSLQFRKRALATASLRCAMLIGHLERGSAVVRHDPCLVG